MTMRVILPPLAAGVFASITIGVVIYIVILRLIKSPEYEVVATVLRKLKGK
jgi:hypothetical protein